MKFKSTFPRLFYHEHQRIVVWLHRSTLRSGEILSPWLVRRWIKCIRDRTNLHDDGIHADLFQGVKERHILKLLLSNTQSLLRRPVNVNDGRDPRRPQFPFRMLLGYQWVRNEKDRCNNT
jgi:hypothetical protein